MIKREKYTINVDKANKEIAIKPTGIFEKEDGVQYNYDFLELVKTIEPSEYTLYVDGRNSVDVWSECAKPLADCLAMYSNLGFKKLVNIFNREQTTHVEYLTALCAIQSNLICEFEFVD